MKFFRLIVLIISLCVYSPLKNTFNSINNQSIENLNYFLLKSEQNIIIDDPSKGDFHTEVQYNYITNPNPESIKNYADGRIDNSRPKGNILDFSKDVSNSDSYVIQYSSTNDFEKEKTITIKDLKEKKYILKNLKLGEIIYYRGAINEEGLLNSNIHKLTVTSLPPRNLDIPGVSNSRDIGGYKTYLVKNGIIKQGLYFRTGRVKGIKEEGKKIVKELGIKREINLRGTDEHAEIDGVSYYYIPMKNTNKNNRFDGYNEEFIKIFDLFSEADKYPIMLHCHAGADRTGVSSFALLALLGVEKNDLAKDYAFTSFSIYGARYLGGDSQFDSWINKLNNFGGNTLAEKVKSWLMSKGIKESVLEHIREIFIDGYGKKEKKEEKEEREKKEEKKYLNIPDEFYDLSWNEKNKIIKQLFSRKNTTLNYYYPKNNFINHISLKNLFEKYLSKKY